MPQRPDTDGSGGSVPVVPGPDATSPWVLDEELAAALAALEAELTPASGFLSVLDYGAVGDGSTDDTEALALAIFAGAAAGTPIYMPAGTYLVSAEIDAPSDTHLYGDGMGQTTITVDPALSLDDSVFVNPTNPSTFVTYSDHNYYFHDFSVDGSGRDYPAYLSDPATGDPIANPAVDVTRNPDWNEHGQIFSLRNASNITFERIEIYDHEDIGIICQGVKNARFLNCRFTGNGRIDATSACIQIKDEAVMKKIVSITNAADGVITTDTAGGALATGSIYLKDISGMNLPDGAYTATVVAGDAVTIGDDTTALGSFADTGLAKLGRAGWTPSVDVVIDNCYFADNNRQAIHMGCGSGGVISNNYFDGHGEATIYPMRSDDLRIVDNTIRNTRLTDISGHPIEANLCTDLLIEGNLIEGSDLTGIAHLGGYGTRIQNNVMRDCCPDNTITYPYGPNAENYASGADYPDATPLDPSYQAGDMVTTATPGEFTAIQVQNLYNYPTKALDISGNRIINTDPASDQLYGIRCVATGVNNISEAISIHHNDFNESGLLNANRVVVESNFPRVVGEVIQRDNQGLSAANTDLTTLVSDYGADYRSIFRSSAQVSTSGATGNTYICTTSASTEVISGTATVQSAGMKGLVIFYFRKADCLFPPGVEPYLRTVVSFMMNGTAPAVTATVGLYPVTVVTSNVTLGTLVTSSDIASGTLNGNTIKGVQSSPYAAPADGPYALGFTLSGTPSGVFDIQAGVQIKGVAE